LPAPAGATTAPAVNARTDNAGTEPAAAPPSKAAVGPLTSARLDAGLAWLEQLPDDDWFIQLFATDADRHGEIESLLRRLASSKTEMSKVHVYYSELSGRPRYGVTYGNYSSKDAALTAIRGLPKPLRANKPYPRQVVRLR
jgi:DamX protein